MKNRTRKICDHKNMRVFGKKVESELQRSTVATKCDCREQEPPNTRDRSDDRSHERDPSTPGLWHTGILQKTGWMSSERKKGPLEVAVACP